MRRDGADGADGPGGVDGPGGAHGPGVPGGAGPEAGPSPTARAGASPRGRHWRRLAAAAAAAVVLSVAAVAVFGQTGTGGGSSPSVEASRPSAALRYEPVQLTGEQREALSAHAQKLQFEGRVPSDVGMVAAPQPEGLAGGSVVVAVEWESCGGTEALEAHFDAGRLFVEVLDRTKEPGSVCAGMGVVGGLRVDLPQGVTAKEVEGVIVRHRPAGH